MFSSGNKRQPCAAHHCAADKRGHYNRAPITFRVLEWLRPDTTSILRVLHPGRGCSWNHVKGNYGDPRSKCAAQRPGQKIGKRGAAFSKKFVAPRMFGLSCLLVNFWVERNSSPVDTLDFNTASITALWNFKEVIKQAAETCFIFPAVISRWGGGNFPWRRRRYKRPHWSEAYINKRGHLLRDGRGQQVHCGLDYFLNGLKNTTGSRACAALQ